MNNNIENNNGYNQAKRINSGLLAIFPHMDAYNDFVEDNNNGIENFIRIAVENHIIDSKKAGDEFKDYIKKNSLDPYQMKSPAGITLSAILQKQITSPIKSLIDKINKLIKEFELEYMVPAGKITYSMFSRLQREPANTRAKRNSIRLLSFGYSYLRPDLSPLWNYERLLGSCPKEPRSEYTQGVRIAFDVYDRDNIIDAKTIKWLKRDILDCIEDTVPIQYKKITSYSTSCFYIDLPKEDPTQNNINLPDSYERCIRQSLVILQQIAVKWALLTLRYPNRILTIGITAGEFCNLDIRTRLIIKSRHPVRSRIVVSDFTRLCVIANKIPISFSKKPQYLEMPHGGSIISWEIKSLLENNPYQLVDYLLDDDLLDIFTCTDFEEMSDLANRIKNINSIINGNGSDEIISLLKYPQNPLLGIEIAKALYFKGKLKAANDILNFLLLRDPSNLSAKINRMNILWNYGFRATSYSISNIHFRQAEKEASEINPVEISFSDDFFCQYAISKIGQAVNILSLLRKGGGTFKENEIILTTNDVLSPLYDVIQKAEKQLFIIPERSQSLFLLFYALGLKYLLSRDEEISVNDDIKIININNLFYRMAEDYFTSLESLPHTLPLNTQRPDLTKKALNIFQSQNDSILLSPAIPNNKYLLAAMIWDFSSIINIDVTNKVATLLEEALGSAQRLKEQKLHAISWLRARNEIVSADFFIQQIKEVIKKIESIRKNWGSLEINEETGEIGEEKSDRLVLFFHNI